MESTKNYNSFERSLQHLENSRSWEKSSRGKEWSIITKLSDTKAKEKKKRGRDRYPFLSLFLIVQTNCVVPHRFCKRTRVQEIGHRTEDSNHEEILHKDYYTTDVVLCYKFPLVWVYSLKAIVTQLLFFFFFLKKQKLHVRVNEMPF